MKRSNLVKLAFTLQLIQQALPHHTSVDLDVPHSLFAPENAQV